MLTTAIQEVLTSPERRLACLLRAAVLCALVATTAHAGPNAADDALANSLRPDTEAVILEATGAAAAAGGLATLAWGFEAQRRGQVRSSQELIPNGWVALISGGGLWVMGALVAGRKPSLRHQALLSVGPGPLAWSFPDLATSGRGVNAALFHAEF